MAIYYDFTGWTTEALNVRLAKLRTAIDLRTEGTIVSGTSTGQTFTMSNVPLDQLWEEHNAILLWLGRSTYPDEMSVARPNFSGRRFC